MCSEGFRCAWLCFRFLVAESNCLDGTLILLRKCNCFCFHSSLCAGLQEELSFHFCLSPGSPTCGFSMSATCGFSTAAACGFSPSVNLWLRSVCYLWLLSVCYLWLPSVCYLRSLSVCYLWSLSVCYPWLLSACYPWSLSACYRGLSLVLHYDFSPVFLSSLFLRILFSFVLCRSLLDLVLVFK